MGRQTGLWDGPYVHPMKMDDEQFEEWLQKIRRGIGGYDIGVLMGLYGSPHDVYLKFLDMSEREPPTAAMLRGIALEDDALKLFADKTGLTVNPLTGSDMFVRHPDNKFLVAQVDAEIVADGKVLPKEMGVGLCDAKVPSNYFFGNYVKTGIPQTNYLQMQWQLGLTGKSWGAFAVLDYEGWRVLGGETPPIIEFDEELFGKMRATAEAFLADHIFTRTPPLADAPVDRAHLSIPVVGNEETKVTEPSQLKLMTRYFKVREQRKLIEHEEKLLRSKIEKLFDELDAGTLVLDDTRKIHFRHGSRKSFDTKAAVEFINKNGGKPENFYNVKASRTFRTVGD